MSDSNAVGEQRPWASPRQNPIKGVVQPRVLPPFGKPTRHTNKLDYIMNTVLKEASKHKHVWPFQKPVDAVGLCIPLYHEKIARPMDLKTIENRLKSTYYTCAQECIDDIETVFNNCYIFNGKEDDVTIMAQNVHEVIKKSLETAPREEHDMEVYWGKNKKKGKSASVTSDKKKDVRGPSEPPSECGSEASGVGKADKKISGKKAGKRKADSDEEEKPESLRVKRDVATHKKENTILPALKPCLKLMNEFYSKKYHDVSWPFHDAVDAELLGLHDYHKIIKEPMDMRKIKGKLESGEYKEPSEFERDFRLMLNNCLVYNPAGDPVNDLGKKFLEVFAKRWAEMDGGSVSRGSSVPPVPPVLTETTQAAPKPVKVNTLREPKKEQKPEVIESPGSKTESAAQLNNALSIVCEREAKLRLELDEVTAMKDKLMEVKNRREENSNEPFPDKLITQAKVMCTVQSSSLPIAPPTAGVKNGKGKRAISTKTHGYSFDSDDEENKKDMSYEDKRGLSMMINKLPPSHLSTIIAIIQRRENSAIEPQHQADSEIEIDFESLGDMCLREMDAFVRSVLNLKKQETTDVPNKNSKQESTENKNPVPSGNKEKKSKNSGKSFNMSESSDDETSNSRKRRKKESSESESSSSSDDESEDDSKRIPRKSGQPPSTSREWNQEAPPLRLAGMGGQPPTARLPPTGGLSKTANSHQSAKPTTTKGARNNDKNTANIPSTSKHAEKLTKKTDTASKTILDSLLPDTFGSSQESGGNIGTASTLSSSADQSDGHFENGENEESRIQRLRMEAKRKREQEDENTVSMSTQMEVMTAFEYDNTY